MFEDVATYSPEDVFLTFGGYTVEGWDNIVVRRTSPEFKTVKGIRGKNTRVADQNDHAVITVICHQTSMSNQVLSAIVGLDRGSQGVRMEVSLVDGNGWEVFSSDEAYVQRASDRVFSTELNNREWNIECLTSRWFDNKVDGDIGSIFSSLF